MRSSRSFVFVARGSVKNCLSRLRVQDSNPFAAAIIENIIIWMNMYVFSTLHSLTDEVCSWIRHKLE